MEKIIFLDIDGVLKRTQDRNINPSLITNIKELVEKTGAKIVISSDWRSNGLDFIKNILSDIQEHIIDITPSFDLKKSYTSTFELNIPIPRGLEIREWINNFNSTEHFVKQYVIIDDSSDMLYNQQNNFVRVKQTVGFDKEALQKALEILNVNY